MANNLKNIQNAYEAILKDHQGGGFIVEPSGVNIDSPPVTAVLRNSDLKPFEVSIYNQDSNEDKVALRFLVNPSDIAFGQTFVSSENYTREGWISTIWGKNQMTINANCTTAAFYVYGVGVSNYLRNFSVSFKNFATFIGMFKNGGYYYFRGEQNKDLFNSDPGRVISVMDLIKISYDGVEYIGSFASLTIDEGSDTPYTIKFNFEFIVSGLRGEDAEGHLRRCTDQYGCNADDTYNIRTQGRYDFDELVSLDIDQLSQTFSVFQRASDYENESMYSVEQRRQAQGLARLNNLTLMNLPVTDPSPYTKKRILRFKGIIIEAANKYNVDPVLIASVIDRESGGYPSSHNPDDDDSGLMQIIPGTWEEIRRNSGLQLNNVFDPRQNVFAGTYYLSQKLKEFGGNEALAVAAYNAGSGNVRHALKDGNGIPDNGTTPKHVAHILSRKAFYADSF